MRKLKILLAFGAIAAGCSPTGVGITDRAQITEAVAGRFNLWSRALTNRSLDTLSSLYQHTREVTLIGTDGVWSRGWSEISPRLEHWNAGLTGFNFVINNSDIDVLDRGVALVTFRSTIDAVSGGNRDHHPGRGTQIWQLDAADGLWKIRAEHQSFVPEP
jgi:ketosteroid isomerase-like protein